MVAVRTPTGLVDDLESLAVALEALDLRASSLLGDNTASARARLVTTIRSYLIPRLTDPATPISVVFAGPTGSGKSTLVNSLSGAPISQTGPIRPTTKGPIALASPAAADSFRSVGDVVCEVVVGNAPILSNLTLLDTPDIDSTETGHRAMAETLIDHADVVVFVTSALRYADEIPWQVLRRAMSRGTPIIHILNRVNTKTVGALADFKTRLAEAGVEGEVIRVPEHHLASGSPAVPSLAVRELARQLVALARDRDGYRKDVFARVLNTTIDQVLQLADVVDAQAELATRVEEEARSLLDRDVSTLDWSHLAPHPTGSEPPEGGWWRRARWVRSNRYSEFDLSRYESAVRSGLVATIEADIRQTVAVDGDDMPGLSSSPVALVADRIRQVTANAVDGWLEEARRMMSVVSGKDRPLAMAALLCATLGDHCPALSRHLLGDASEAFVTKSRATLWGRVEVVYTQAGAHLGDLVRSVVGEPQSDVVRERLTAVVARSHFADA